MNRFPQQVIYIYIITSHDSLVLTTTIFVKAIRKCWRIFLRIKEAFLGAFFLDHPARATLKITERLHSEACGSWPLAGWFECLLSWNWGFELKGPLVCWVG